MSKSVFKFKNEDLLYQPIHDAIKKVNTAASMKNLQHMFSVEGWNAAMQNTNLVKAYVDTIGDLFKGSEELKNAYTSCANRTIREHNNMWSQYVDADGNDASFGIEGWGSTAPNGGYNAYTRLAPVLTAGYLARCRALEAFLVINDDKPTFFRQYTVTYVQKGLGGERLLLPQAIRDGKLTGMLDLPLCEPKACDAASVADKNEDNKNVNEFALDNGTKIPMIKVGSTGNLMDQSTFADGTPIDKTKHALERQASIDYVRVSFKIGKANPSDEAEQTLTKVIPIRLERIMKEGKTSEREFDEVLEIPYTDAAGNARIRVVRIVAVLDLDTGWYQVMTDGLNEVTHIHFKVRVTNVANQMETYMTGQDTFNYSFDIENKIYGSIPLIPEMMADYNAAGDGVSWVAYMTDQMTEAYSGIRDNDLENFIDEEYQYSPSDNGFKLNKKLGGFKFNGVYPLIPRQPGGSDDILAPQRMAFKHYLTRVFTRSEKWTNFDRGIERQWVIFANDEDVDILPEIQWTTNSAAIEQGGSASSEFRYGWSLDDAYGFTDSLGRRARVIGSRDSRWLNRSIWCINKSLTMAAPTTVYFPYMFRVFSSISPDLRNRAAMLFASRDAKRVATLVQARITLEGNDLNLYANSAAFAAGFKGDGNQYTPMYATERQTTLKSFSTVGGNNVPDYQSEPGKYNEPNPPAGDHN